MNRRGFLKLFGNAAIVASTNPVHFIAPIGGWTSDVIINPNGLSETAVEAIELEQWMSLESSASGIFGVKYWLTSGSGSFAGIERASYPGKMRMPFRA